jgi:hypothetical protein
VRVPGGEVSPAVIAHLLRDLSSVGIDAATLPPHWAAAAARAEATDGGAAAGATGATAAAWKGDGKGGPGLAVVAE